MTKLLISLAIGSVLAASSAASAQDQARAERLVERPLPTSLQSLKLASPSHAYGVDVDSLQRSTLFGAGANKVIIRLSADSGAEAFAKGKDTVSQYFSKQYRASIKASNKAAEKFADVPDQELLEDIKAFVIKGAKDGDSPASCS